MLPPDLHEKDDDTLLPPQDVETEPEVTDEEPISEETSEEEIERRARAQGWFPETEWDERRAARQGRSKPHHFLSAKEFLDRAEEKRPVLLGQMRRLEKELEEQKRIAQEAKELAMEQKRMSAEAVAKARADERRKVEDEMRAAVADGDLEKHDEALKKLKEIDKVERQEETQPAQPKAIPEIDAWVGRNPWFTARGNEHLNAVMIAEHKAIQASHPHLSATDQLDAAKDRVMERFPEAFGRSQAPRRGPGGAEYPNNRRDPNAASVEARFARLDSTSKSAYERLRQRFANMNGPDGKPINYTKEEYLKEYVG